jgi:hypothetical protein
MADEAKPYYEELIEDLPPHTLSVVPSMDLGPESDSSMIESNTDNTAPMSETGASSSLVISPFSNSSTASLLDKGATSKSSSSLSGASMTKRRPLTNTTEYDENGRRIMPPSGASRTGSIASMSISEGGSYGGGVSKQDQMSEGRDIIVNKSDDNSITAPHIDSVSVIIAPLSGPQEIFDVSPLSIISSQNERGAFSHDSGPTDNIKKGRGVKSTGATFTKKNSTSSLSSSHTLPPSQQGSSPPNTAGNSAPMSGASNAGKPVKSNSQLSSRGLVKSKSRQ